VVHRDRGVARLALLLLLPEMVLILLGCVGEFGPELE